MDLWSHVAKPDLDDFAIGFMDDDIIALDDFFVRSLFQFPSKIARKVIHIQIKV